MSYVVKQRAFYLDVWGGSPALPHRKPLQVLWTSQKSAATVFASRQDAYLYAGQHGGRIVRLVRKAKDSA